jgi:hypothetical protein
MWGVVYVVVYVLCYCITTGSAHTADSAAPAASCCHLCNLLLLQKARGADHQTLTSNPHCRSYGTLVGEPVILVATGIGPGAAIICLAEVSTPLYITWHWMTLWSDC